MALVFATILISLMLISLFCLPIYGMRLLLRRRDYTREHFALVAFSVIVTLTVTLTVFLATNLMPWHLQAAMSQVLSGQEINLPEVLWSEQALLVFLYGMLVGGIVWLHGGWHGLKSTAQYRREQNSEAPNLFSEGLDEFWRLIKGQPARELYSKRDWRDFIAELEPVTDTLTWPEQACELLCLSSSAYVFDSADAWHQKAGCWVGQNLDSGELVFLYPVQVALSESKIKRFVDYANKIAAQQNNAQAELIIISKEHVARSLRNGYRSAIRVESEFSLLDNLVDFRLYANDICKRVLADKLPDSELTLDQVYVPSHFNLPHGQKASQNVEQYLRKWLLEPGQRQLALLGEYGQGKSTATQMLTYHLLQQGPPTRFPILIELRGRSPRNLTPLDLLGAWGARYRIDPQALMRLLIAGRLLLIFEGFDEVALVGDAEMRLNHFKALWQFSYPQAKILFTGRPNFFLDDQEMKAALGISKPLRHNKPYCEAIRLAPFELSQIKTSLEAHKPPVRQQIYALAQKNVRFQELISRPSLLHIVSVLWVDEKLSEKAEQLNSAYVMKLFVEQSYHRQALKKLDVRRNFMALTTSERDYFMSGVASYMAANQLPNQISGTELNQLIDALIEAIPDAVSTDSSAINGETMSPLQQRLEETPDRIEHIKTDVRACGLLVDDPATPGTFRFGHKSFMEYLFAAVLAEHILEESPAKTKSILKATNAKIEDILYLSVSCDFIVELMEPVHKNHTSGSSIGKQDKEVGSEYYVAKKLFTTFLSTKYKIVMFLYYKNSKIKFDFINLFKNNTIVSVGNFAFFIVIFYHFYKFYNNQEFYKNNIIYFIIYFISLYSFVRVSLLLFLYVFNVLFVVIVNIILESYDDKVINLWKKICKNMRIEDDVLHRVAGTWIIPWVKDQPFDYFLPKDERK